MNKQNWAFMISIALLSTLTGNYSLLFDPITTSFFLLSLSFGIFLFIHWHSHKIYLSIANLRRNEITKGLLVSSIIGAVLIILLSLYTYNIIRTETINLEELNFRMDAVSLIIGVIYIICMGFLFGFDFIIERRVGKIKLFFASFAFYLFTFVTSFIIGFIVSLTTF